MQEKPDIDPIGLPDFGIDADVAYELERADPDRSSHGSKERVNLKINKSTQAIDQLEQLAV